MDQLFRRVLSLFLAFALVVSYVPTSVFAEEETTEVIHEHYHEITATVGATCTEDGYIRYECECGDSYEEPIPAPGHSYAVTASVDATCTEAGSATYTCSVCGDSYTEAVDALGHSYEEAVTYATCTKDGSIVYTCSVCGDSYAETIPAAHSYEETVTDATCTEAGSVVKVCSACGDTQEETIPAAGHSYNAEGKCAVCGTPVPECTCETPCTDAVNAECDLCAMERTLCKAVAPVTVETTSDGLSEDMTEATFRAAIIKDNAFDQPPFRSGYGKDLGEFLAYYSDAANEEVRKISVTLLKSIDLDEPLNLYGKNTEWEFSAMMDAEKNYTPATIKIEVPSEASERTSIFNAKNVSIRPYVTIQENSVGIARALDIHCQVNVQSNAQLIVGSQLTVLEGGKLFVNGIANVGNIQIQAPNVDDPMKLPFATIFGGLNANKVTINTNNLTVMSGANATVAQPIEVYNDAFMTALGDMTYPEITLMSDDAYAIGPNDQNLNVVAKSGKTVTTTVDDKGNTKYYVVECTCEYKCDQSFQKFACEACRMGKWESCTAEKDADDFVALMQAGGEVTLPRPYALDDITLAKNLKLDLNSFALNTPLVVPNEVTLTLVDASQMGNASKVEVQKGGKLVVEFRAGVSEIVNNGEVEIKEGQFFGMNGGAMLSGEGAWTINGGYFQTTEGTDTYNILAKVAGTDRILMKDQYNNYRIVAKPDVAKDAKITLPENNLFVDDVTQGPQADNATRVAIVEEIVKASAKMPDPVIPEASQADVEEVKIAYDGMTIASEVVTKASFDVTPVDTADNKVTGKEITFSLPVHSAVVHKYAKVFHEGTYVETVEILTGDAGNKYITITASDFSVYSYETTDEAPVVEETFPVYIGTQGYESLAKAIEAAQPGDKIVVEAEDLDADDLDVTVNKAVTIDLGGNTLTDAYIQIAADVTLENGSIKNTNEPYPLVVKSGKLTIENVAIEASKSDRAIWLDGNGATLDFNSGSILATKGENNTKSSIYGVWVSTGATANINGGSITVDAGPNATAVAIFGNYANTVNVTGGKISTSGKNYSYAIWVDGDVTVTGGEIVTNEKQYGYSSGITYGNNYAIHTKGDVEISGGKITTNGYSGYLVNAGGSNQEVTISNVEFTNVLSETDKTAGGHSEPNLIYGSSVTAEITGGDFEGVNAQLIKGTGSTLTVSGGTFDVAISEDYLAEGVEIKQNADGSFGIQEIPPVAKIGETGYDSLEAAFADAVAGDTITLFADATPALTSQRAITKAAVIDLGGNTLTLTEDDLYFGTTTFKNGTIVVDPSVSPSTAVFWMFANQTLTFDAVKIIATGVTGTYLIGLDGANADLNLLNGSEILVENTTALDLDIICVNGANGNDIVIDNSKVNVTNLDGRVFFRGNYTVKGNTEIALEGITKAGFRIEEGQTLSIQDTASVIITGEPRDGGIHLTDLTATYTVANTATVTATTNIPVAVAAIGDKKFTSLQDAIDAVQNGETITLLADCAETVSINKSGVAFTIDGKVSDTENITYTGKIEINIGQNVTIQNIDFVHTGNAAHDFIANVGSPTGKNYNITLLVDNCSFTGNGLDNTVAVRTIHPTSVKIQNSTGTGLHSFLQNTGGQKVEVNNVTVTDSKGGLAVGTTPAVTIRECNISTDTYGIRLDAVLNTNATLNGNTVNAYIPVSVRKATATDYKLTFSGSDSSYTATNTDGVWCAICNTEYEEGVALNEATGNVKVTFNTDVLDQSSVYGAYEYPIKVVFSDGYTKGFDSLTSAMNYGYSGGTQEKIIVNENITESMDSLEGNIVTENPNGVTIKNTIVDAWIYCSENFTIGEGVTYDATGHASGLFMYADNAVINGTVLTDCYYQRYAHTKLTINEPGSMTVKTETFILRYTDGDGEAGIYIVGDNNDETVGLNASVIYFYQGMINAKDADIKVGTYWQTNETDNQGSANLVLDNSNMTVTVNEHNMKATGTSTVTLTNGSNVSVAGGYEGVGVKMDATSSFTKNGAAVLAAEVNGIAYATLQDAIDAAEDGDTITLVTDIEQADGVLIDNKNLIIDLNGKTFTVTEGASTNNRNFKITGTSVVTIKNGTMVAAGEYASGAYGTVRTEGTANVTLEDLKLYNYRGNGLNVKALDGTTVTMTDVEVYSEYGGGIEAAGGTIELNNVTVDQKGMYTAPYNSMAISVNGGGTVTVNSGTYSTVCLTAEEANNQGTSHGPWVAGVLNSGGTLIINGGTFSNDNFGENSAAAYARGLILADTGANIQINDGSFIALKSIIDIQNNLGDASKNPTGEILGGIFSADPTNDYVKIADGYTAVQNADGTWGLKADMEAMISSKFYSSLSTALSAAKNGDTILLLANARVDELDINKNVTINLNDKKLTLTTGGNNIFGDVTITNGTINVSGVTADGDCIIGIGDYSNNGKLTLDNVTLTGSNYSSAFAVLYVYNTSELNIANSNITLSNDKSSEGGFIKAHKGKDGIVNITDTDISLTDAKIGFLDGTVKFDGVELDIKGGANAINQSALTVIDSTITVDGADGRALTLAQGEISVTNSTLNFTNCSEGEIRFKQGLALTLDGASTLNECSVYADAVAVDAANINGNAITGVEGNESTATVAGGKTTVVNPDWAFKVENSNTYYMTLADAVKADGTVVLLRDIELSESVKVANGTTVTLDLNGNTITGTDDTTANFGLIENRGNLTIKDSVGDGKITLTATTDTGFNRYSSVISNNPGGTLTVESGTLEHLGGTSMAYGIDNLTNGKGTYAETIIKGGTVKSTYRGIRQFLNGVEAQNILTINGGTVEGANKSVWMQDPNKNANTGTLTVGENASLKGDVYLSVTAESTEWPVKVSIDSDALKDGAEVLTANVPAGYELVKVDGVYGVKSGVAKIGTDYYATFEAALAEVENGETIEIMPGVTGSENKDIDFTKDISFTITGNNTTYALPTITFQNATVTIKDAEILIPELDARQNATINVVDSIVHDAGGNSIVKSYFNGKINISGTSVVHTMQVTTAGYITVSDTAKLNATWQTNAIVNGLITIKDNATLATGALQLTGATDLNGTDYSVRANTDTDRVGKSAQITVDDANLIVGKVYSDKGDDYSYNSSKGINIGTVDGKTAVLDIKNGAKVNVYMANGETANIGAGGTVNLDASTFNVECRSENGAATVTNKGVVYVTGASDIAGTFTGEGWVYMNGVTLDADTKLYGARVGFINGTNEVVGSTIEKGWFNVGIGSKTEAPKADAFAAAKGISLGNVIVNVSGDAVISSGGSAYNGWVGSAYSADKTQNKYVLNIENSLAAFGYIHVSKDGELNVEGHATNKYTYDNANVDFYAGDLIVNGKVTMDGTDAWVKYTKMSADHADGVLNIVNGTKYESSIHNGSNTKESLIFYKAAEINVDESSAMEIDNVTTLTDGAELNVAGAVTAKGAVNGIGTITLTDENATYTAAENLTVKSALKDWKVEYKDGVYKLISKVYVAKIGDEQYESLADAVKAVQDGQTITLYAVEFNEGTIKLPAALKNVTFKGAEGAALKDMTIMAHDGNAINYEGLTFTGITFDNSRISVTGWRNGNVTVKDFTVTDCIFKNLNDTTNSAPVHFNMAATEPVQNLTFTNNVIDGATGGSKSGVYAQVTGKTTFTGNTINNVAFRPYLIQLTTDDGIADEFIVTGNTFSGSAAGRAQALTNNDEGTDTVKLVVSENIFKDITSAQQICYWNFNTETTTVDLSKNYYDIDIQANPGMIYFNSPAKNAEDLMEMGVYPYYADEAKTTLVEAPHIMVTYADGTIEYFDDMLEAVPYTTNYPKLEGATITLLKDTSGAGMRFMENDMVFDLNGHTYTITAGTGSQGTNTSGFQIRSEVTGTATIKNGTIEVAEGVAIVWMFNNYATDFIVENVTVDCANMAWSYGEQCYVHVSRSGDNTQFTGDTKILNFNSADAGNAINVGGTMTIGENVVPGGAIELDAGATLTAPAGLTVVTVDGYVVVYENGVYKTAEVVATIGNVPYTSLADALAATKDNDTVTILKSTSETIGVPAGNNVTIKAAEGVELSGGVGGSYYNKSVTLDGLTFKGGKGIAMTAGVEGLTYTIKNCTFDGVQATAWKQGVISLNGKATAVLENNTIKNVQNATEGDGRIESQGQQSTGIYVSGAAEVTVTGNTISKVDGTGINVVNPTGKAIITGNTISDWGTGATAKNEGRAIRTSGGSEVIITGNKMIDNGTAKESFVKATGTASLDASGNYWGGNDPTDTTIFEYDIVKDPAEIIVYYYTDAEMTQKVDVAKAVAQVGNTFYTDLTEALKAAKDGDTVTIFEGTYDYALNISSESKNLTVKGEGNVTLNGVPTLKGTNYKVENIDFVYNDSYSNLSGSGLIKDCSFTANVSTFRYCYGTKDAAITFDGCALNAPNGWAIHFDSAPNMDLTFTDCVVNGRVALGGDLGKLTATGTEFKTGYVNVWGTDDGATFTGCDFENVPYIYTGSSADDIFNFNNCTVDGTDAKTPADIILGGNDNAAAKIYVNGDLKSGEAKIGDTYYWTLEEALAAAKADDTITLLKNLTFDGKWDCRTAGTFDAPVTIDGNGKTLTFTGEISDGYNNLAVFRFNDKATVKNLTIDMSEADAVFQNRFSAISAKADLTVEGCTFIGSTTATNARAIIYGEGENTPGVHKVNVTNSEFINWGYGVVDHMNGTDTATDVTITGNTFTDSNVMISAGTKVTFNNNIVSDGAYVNITSYGAETTLNVEAKDNTMSAHENTKVTNAVSYDNIQPEFSIGDPARIGNKYYNTLAKAVAAAKEGETVNVVADITLKSTVTIDKSIILDLGENTITGTGAGYRPIKVAGNNSDIAVTIQNGTIETKNVTTKPTQAAALLVYDGADVTLENVNVTGSNYGVMMAGYYGYANGIANNNVTSLKVNDGTVITAANAAIIPQGAYPNVDIEINAGAEVISTDSIAIYMPTKGDVTVNGGTITGATAIYHKCGNLTVNGGTITGNGDKAGYEYVNSGAETTGDAIVIDSCGYLDGSVPTVAINGGIISSENASAVASYAGNGVTEAVKGFITGGSFNTGDVEALLAPGYSLSYSGGMYGVEVNAVARLNGKDYPSIHAAIEAAKDGETVYLLDDTAGAGVVIDKDISIDLKGYTYTFTQGVGSTGTESNGFQILKDNDVTIKNGVLAVASEAADKFYTVIQNYANLTLEDVTLDGTNLDKWSKVENNWDSYTLSINSGEVNIIGKTNIIANDEGINAFAFDVCDSASYTNPTVNVKTTGKINGNIEVSEGLENNLTIYNGLFTVDVSQYCAEGLTAQKNDKDLYEIVAKDDVASVNGKCYTSLEAAIKAAGDGDVIQVLNDIEAAASIVVDKNVTLDLNGHSLYAAETLSAKPVVRVLANVTVTNGTVDGTNGENSYAFIVGDSTTAGTLNIADGTYMGITSVVSITKGTANISGGEFATAHDGEGTDYGATYLLNCIDAAYKNGEAVYNVTGGTFVGFDPMNNDAEGEGTNFVNKDYTSFKGDNDTYEVVELFDVAEVNGKFYKTLAAAVEAAGKGDTVNLLVETVGAGAVINEDITIDLQGNAYFFNEGVGSTGTESNGFQILKGHNVTIRNGVLAVASEAADKFYTVIQNYANLTLEDVTLDGENLDKWSKVENNWDSYTLSINSGTVNIKGDTTIVANKEGKNAFAFDVCKSASYTAPTVTVDTFGMIDGNIEVSEDIKDNLTVVNGTFTMDVSEYCNEGYAAVKNEENLYVIEKLPEVAKIGDEIYYSLEDAIAEADDGDVIEILESIVTDTTIVVDKAVTLKLNGNVLSASNKLSGAPVIRVLNDVTVTGGCVNGATGINSYAFIVGSYTEKGTLTIADGYYKGITSAISITNGTVNISGGDFETGHDGEGEDFGAKYLLNCIDSNYNSGKAVYNITGGHFVGFDPMNNEAEGKGTNFVHKYYETYEDNGVFHVVDKPDVACVNGVNYKLLDEAVAAAQNGDTVYILNSVDGAGVVINKSITIDLQGNSYTFNKGVGSTGTESNGFQILKGNNVTIKNGVLNVASEAADKFYTVIQNYADLTVENMLLDGTNLDKWSGTDGDSYTLSINSGTVNIKGDTTIIANDDGNKAFAFDVCDSASYTNPTVTVDTFGIIDGNIEVSENLKDNLTVLKGTFTMDVSEYCEYGFVAQQIENGKYVIVELPDVAKVGNKIYKSLADAVNAAQPGEVVELLKSTEGAGVVINKDITIDLQGNIYSFNEGVGSTGTESNGFQILKGNKVTIRNGALNVAPDAASKFYMLIQNYADLTVRDVTLDGINLDKWAKDTDPENGDSYVLSNNSGTVNIEGNTTIIANDDGDKAFAFDVCKYGSYDAPTVNVNTTGKILGKIEVTEGLEDNLNVTFGYFSEDVSDYCIRGYTAKWNDQVNLFYIVDLPYVASVNGENFKYLDDAVKAAQSGEVVELLADAAGAGVVINKNITIDLKGHTYTFTEGVGSTGTESNGFQILKDNDVTIKNGTLNVADEAADKFYTVIQNYANLTVEDVTLDGTNLDKWAKDTAPENGDSYVLSINSGEVNIIGETNFIANNDGDKNFAFDVCKNASYAAPVVNVNTTGKIEGKIEVSADINSNLNISGGTFTVEIAKDWCAKGFVPVDNGDGTYGVKVYRLAAKIGETEYETLQEAVDAAGSDDVIELMKTILREEEVILVDKEVTIKKNDFTAPVAALSGFTTLDNDGFYKVVTVSSYTQEQGPAIAYIVGDKDTKMTLQEALNKAQSGDIVRLYEDLSIPNSTVIIPTGVTLDIESNTVEVKNLVGLNGSKLTANYMNSATQSGSGYLKIKKDNLVLDDGCFINTSVNYGILPVWNPDDGWYEFTLARAYYDPAKMDSHYFTVTDDQIYFRFRHQVGGYYMNNVLNDGGLNNGIKVILTLSWKTDDGVAYQTFEYNDDMFQIVNNATNKDYIFSLTNYKEIGISFDDLENPVTITTSFVTDCGVMHSIDPVTLSLN